MGRLLAEKLTAELPTYETLTPDDTGSPGTSLPTDFARAYLPRECVPRRDEAIGAPSHNGRPATTISCS